MKDKVIALLVQSVEPGSIAEKAGLQPGDLIYRLRGIYFEKHSAEKQLNNILGHSLKRFTMLYFAASGESRSVIIPRPQSTCEQSQTVYTIAENLLAEIEIYRPSSPIQPLSISYLTTNITSPDVKAKEFLQLPNCEDSDDDDSKDSCQSLADKIKHLSDRIPLLRSALEIAQSIAKKDISQLTEERQQVYQEGLALLEDIKENRWNKEGEDIEKLKIVDRHWRDHKANMLIWEEDMIKAAREYATLSKDWTEDFKDIQNQLVELQQHKQMVAMQKNQQVREQEQIATEQALTAMLERHHAENLTLSPHLTLSLVKNPYAYQSRNVFIQGLYVQHIKGQQALIDVAPTLSPIGNIIQLETSRNLALNLSVVRCVVEVLGTTMILQGGIERTIPNVKEIECLP